MFDLSSPFIQTRDSTKHIKGAFQAKYNVSDEDFAVIREVIVDAIPHKAGL